MHFSENLQVSMQTGNMIFQEEGKEVGFHEHPTRFSVMRVLIFQNYFRQYWNLVLLVF